MLNYFKILYLLIFINLVKNNEIENIIHNCKYEIRKIIGNNEDLINEIRNLDDFHNLGKIVDDFLANLNRYNNNLKICLKKNNFEEQTENQMRNCIKGIDNIESDFIKLKNLTLNGDFYNIQNESIHLIMNWMTVSTSCLEELNK